MAGLGDHRGCQEGAACRRGASYEGPDHPRRGHLAREGGCRSLAERVQPVYLQGDGPLNSF